MQPAEWVSQRAPGPRLHLDAAACGRQSRAVLAAQVGHLQAESGGAYLAEEAAGPDLAAGRAAVGSLLGLPGDALAYTHGAADAFERLLASWPLPAGARVGTVPSEFEANASALRRLAAGRGWQLVTVPVDPAGRIVQVPAGLDLLTFPQVPSQRGVVQPVAELLAAGVPIVLDVAQGLGQTAVPPGCAGYVGTSRKWLCGPRGVGFLAVAPPWQERLQPAGCQPERQGGLGWLEPAEAHVAGRVGLAVAAREWTAGLLPLIHARAAQARSLLAGVVGCAVVEPVEEPSGITTLVLAERDPASVRAALVGDGVVVSAVPITRAEDLSGPLLRVSTPAWVGEADLERLAHLLRRHLR